MARFYQKPFPQAFPDKEATNEIRIAEGHYAVAKGYQEVTHKGEYLGIPATGEKLEIRHMDIWRREGDELVKNWVTIDLLGFLEQAELRRREGFKVHRLETA